MSRPILALYNYNTAEALETVLTGQSTKPDTMNDFDIFADEYASEDPAFPHLPLDWNEDLSLEEYLERVQQQSDKINNAI